jgi:threonine/homoserine/homoserine lactone efflux protein|uniref:LysE family transporter n=1 Tax=Candidatus Limnocylindrus sp. TaxID=2802978 RepID=UPI0040492B38
MFGALLAGMFAGFAVAVPVGVIAVLIIETGMMGGLRRGLAAGAGAATVDLLFCSLALVVGGLLNQFLSVALVPLQVLAGGVLISIGARGLLSLRASSTSADAATDPRVRGSAGQLYLRFIALTAMNPATILYFLALAIGLPGIGNEPINAVAFTVGAAGASLSWQLLLGAIGAAAGRILPERAVTATRIVGQVLIIGFGISIAAVALRSIA